MVGATRQRRDRLLAGVGRAAWQAARIPLQRVGVASCVNADLLR